MSLTIENQISNLITNRLKDHMINGATISISDDVPNARTLLELISISGTSVYDYPRKFEISISSSTLVHIKETTLFADLGNSAPTPFESDVSYVIGTPFVISDSGLSATAHAGVSIGNAWTLRIGQASNTVTNIDAHPFDYTSLPTPSISVYSTDTENDKEISNVSSANLTVVCILCVDAQTFEAGIGYEIIGDIQDCINRDRALWDNTQCLASECFKKNHSIIDRSDSGTVIFKIEINVKYRTQLKNSRSK